MKFVASLTTTPYRINQIRDTIESILNQTIQVNCLELNIPLILKRTGEIYQIPQWLLDLEENSKNTKCEIKIFRTDDYGPITKVAPTLIRYKGNKDVFIWSLDDDIDYPVNMLATLFREYIPSKDRVLCHSGGDWRFDPQNLCAGYEANRRERDVNFAEGHASILYPAHLVKNDFEDYLNKVLENEDSNQSDDVIISNYFVLNNIIIHCCAYPYREDSLFLINCILKYGMNSQALHRQGGGNQKRYIRVYEWLKENNLNGWVNNNLIKE